MWIVSFITLDSYVTQLLLVFLGTLVLAFGISLSVVANVVMNSGEAFVKAVSDTTRKNFGNLKIIFDVFCVAAAIGLSVVFFDFEIEGTREGTIIAALFTGLFVKLFLKYIHKPVNQMLERS